MTFGVKASKHRKERWERKLQRMYKSQQPSVVNGSNLANQLPQVNKRGTQIRKMVRSK